MKFQVSVWFAMLMAALAALCVGVQIYSRTAESRDQVQTRVEVAQAALRIWADKASAALLCATYHAPSPDAWGTRIGALRAQIERPQFIQRMTLADLCAEIERSLQEAPQCPYSEVYRLYLEEYREVKALEDG